MKLYRQKIYSNILKIFINQINDKKLRLMIKNDKNGGKFSGRIF